MATYEKKSTNGKDVRTTKQFDKWLRSIKKGGNGGRVTAIMDQFQTYGHVKNIYEVKSIKNAKDLLEYRLLIQRMAIRLYYSNLKLLLVLFLLGGNKNNQVHDIEIAKRLLLEAKGDLGV